MNAPRRFVIPNPLPSTLSFRIRFSGANIRGPAHCHSESALAVRNLLFRLIVSGSAPRHSRDVRFPHSARNRSVSGYAFRRPATDAPLPPRVHRAQPPPHPPPLCLSSEPASAWREPLSRSERNSSFEEAQNVDNRFLTRHFGNMLIYISICAVARDQKS